MKWQLQSSQTINTLEDLKKILLQNRQITDEAAFFSPPHPQKYSLDELGFDQEAAGSIKKRLQIALEHKEKIVVFGDYDADGITATAVLWQALHALGHRVYPFIPHRLKHGYGLSIKALADVFTLHQDVSLIVTVDNGIVAHQALDYLASKKIDVIITDHHQKDGRLPQALAVFHSPLVCGCGVAWFLSRELGLEESKLNELLSLVAIATVTDLMPIIGVNRSILTHGLQQLRQSQQLGLRALVQAAGIEQNRLDAHTLGYQLGPRINAMGRLADGMDALRLLCTNNVATATKLSHVLQQTNSDRQNLTTELVVAAESVVQSELEEKLIFLASPDYHEGIIGLIAGKMTEKFAKPSIVLSVGEKVSKASARSLPGFNITEFIRLFHQELLEMGGHPLAAGFAVASDKIERLKQVMQVRAKEMLRDVLLEKTLVIDAPISHSLVSLITATMIESFAPFGLGNAQPNFLIKDVQLKNYRFLGVNQQHLKMTVLIGAEELPVLAWSGTSLLEEIAINDRFDLVCQLQVNEYRGKANLQLVYKDLQKTRI